MIKTMEEAYQFVKEVKVCTIFGSDKCKHPSLWERVDLPEKQPGEKGWGQKVNAVWSWKNKLPATYPDEIFYGKIKGGLAVLMEMTYLRDVHFIQSHEAIDHLPELQQSIYEKIRLEPRDTTSLRKQILSDHDCSKSQFDSALKNLQVSMNIVRSNEPDLKQDIWLPFKEVYLNIWQHHLDD
ncbi:MAG: hypothetical protein AAGA18_14655 [Verrucomicrobiota bacterium]